ncbi:NAD-dependent epimerase/dehydratase family protein [Aerococcaceae bacterium WGS1372]
MRILITGKNSFVGNHLATWLEKSDDNFDISKISLKDDQWRGIDFSNFDVVVHVAGIAHVSTDPNMEEKYYKVNRDLTEEVALKAKNEGVKQFVFLSSIIVYDNQEINTLHITESTNPEPANFYGDSKLQAEERIKPLESDDFKVAIIRPPMVYGKGSKGNYPKLSKFSRVFPIFPDYNNQRSMIHIDILSEFIRLVMVNQDSGIFYPQNREYVRTTDLMVEIRKAHGKKTYLTKVFNPIIDALVNRITLLNKLFGSLTYDLELSKYSDDYQILSFEETIKETER